MNSFGRIFRVSIFGESHGASVGIVIDGCPSGIELNEADFADDLFRRQGGNQKGTTPRKEDDFPIIESGFFKGKTTGSPIIISFKNKNTRSADYEKQRAIPRPGHSDFVATEKYKGFEDFRGGGHFSGRLTVGLVAAGVIARRIIDPMNVQANLIEVGGEKDVQAGLQKAIDAKDSVGGIIECRVAQMPVGLGEPFFDSCESIISHLVFSIPAIKGIEFGSGFTASTMFGSEHNDALADPSGKTITNHAGGINGGISNGNDLIFRVAVKPTSSTPKVQESLNRETGKIEPFSIKGRHDLCIALRVPVILEAVTAIALADLMLIERAYNG